MNGLIKFVPPRTLLLFMAWVALGIFTVLNLGSANTYAAPVTGFNAGRIIEDSVFTNSSSMTPSQIQMFLNNKVPVCDTQGTQPSEYGGGTRAQWGAARGTPPPYVCLKNYTENGRAAAQIIYDIAQAYSINPQVLIVLLQKEQALVTDTWPTSSQYRTATGYGCPDTAPCDSQYYGLTNQLTWSAKMFRAILNNSPSWYTPYVLGNNSIRWNPSASCGSSIVNIENRSTQALYNYTPYRPNQAALNAGYGMGDSCSAYGNRNFYQYFKDWFGYNAGPVAFRASSTSPTYVMVEGYKLTVPNNATMQDYGISNEAVQTVSQAYVDSIQSPPQGSGISGNISHVVKSPRDDDEDGASVYLISRGTRYQFQSMQQFYDFGFSEQDISYIPLSYIFSKDYGSTLPNFVVSPYGSVFKVEGNIKRIIFEYGTYISQNPSDRVALLSYYLVDKITSGKPITDRPVLVKYSQGDNVNLYVNGNYYTIPTYDVFSCWGFEGAQNVPTYRVPQDSYLQPITPTSSLSSCLTSNNGSVQVMNGTSRLNATQSSGLTSSFVLDSGLQSVANRLPQRQGALSQYVKFPGNAAVYSIENGSLKVIPSYRSFQLLGLSDSAVDVVPTSALQSLPDTGIKLANGQLVKSTSSGAVYTISTNGRMLYPSSELFVAYGNPWNAIETFDGAALDRNYPYQSSDIRNYLVDKQTDSVYVIAKNGCFNLKSSDYTHFGVSIAGLKTNQPYDIDSVRDVSTNCAAATRFIKQSDNSLVYWVENGKKQPLTTYSAMLSKNGGQNPTVMVVSPEFIQNIPNS